MDIRFFDQDGLRVAGDAAGEGIGPQAQRLNGSTVNSIGAADRGAERAMVPRTMFPCGPRFVIMRQAVSAETKAGRAAARRPPRCAPTASGSRGTWRWSGTGPGQRQAGNR